MMKKLICKGAAIAYLVGTSLSVRIMCDLTPHNLVEYHPSLITLMKKRRKSTVSICDVIC